MSFGSMSYIGLDNISLGLGPGLGVWSLDLVFGFEALSLGLRLALADSSLDYITD